jgi:aspartokinase/homoserine dehydrogenase 1
MMPCIEKGIPLYVRNVFDPMHPGTVIQGNAPSLLDSVRAQPSSDITHLGAEGGLGEESSKRADESPIKGITSVDNVALVNLEGTGTSSVPNLAGRFFGALASAEVSCLMVSQASADSSP